MDKVIKTIIILFSTLFISCSNDETVVIDSENNKEQTTDFGWNYNDISTVFDPQKGYYIPTKKLQEIVASDQVVQVRFIPGVIENKLWVKIVSLNSKEEIIGQFLVAPKGTDDIKSKLVSIQSKRFNKNSEANKIVASHILQPNEAIDYLNSWGRKSTTDIDDVTILNGERIRHYSLSPVVVRHMANQPVSTIYLSWGINYENKLTTVFTPIENHKINLFSKGSNRERENAYIYDFSRPCPTMCDIGGDDRIGG
ncbi:hypothetical protein ACFSTE_16670 [Aquimarina hainanensis]|uniref:DUF4837 family protein n=1 Tax=Aquimarina hainanensis TaxID=1578017 RepID=A0ABW5ND18_9FLAO